MKGMTTIDLESVPKRETLDNVDIPNLLTRAGDRKEERWEKSVISHSAGLSEHM